MQGPLSPGLRFKGAATGLQHRCDKGSEKCWWVTSARRGVSQEFSNVQGFAYMGDILAWWTLMIPLYDPLTLGYSHICKIDNDAAIFYSN